MKRVTDRNDLVDFEFYLVAKSDGVLVAARWVEKHGLFAVGDYHHDIEFEDAFLVLEVEHARIQN